MKLKRWEAESEAKEERSWTCESCSKMIEDGEEGPHCSYCKSYWTDVSNGLFDEEW